MFLLVPAYPGGPGQTAVKWLLLLLLLYKICIQFYPIQVAVIGEFCFMIITNIFQHLLQSIYWCIKRNDLL